jgi:class 3 adenylate cyclase
LTPSDSKTPRKRSNSLIPLSPPDKKGSFFKLSTYLPIMIIQHCIEIFSEKLKKGHDLEANEKMDSKLEPSLKYLSDSSILIADVAGFTKLSENFASQGTAGIEMVSVHLNKFFSGLLDIISFYGGDCVKFAGDALIVLFNNSKWNAFDCTVRAISCAIDMQKQGVHIIETSKLSLHIGIATGPLYCMYVGGIENEWEFLLCGYPFSKIGSALDFSKSGDVVVSRDSWNLVKDVCIGFEVLDSFEGEAKVTSFRQEFFLYIERESESVWQSSNVERSCVFL